GTSWSRAWAGPTRGLAISALMRDPKANHVWLTFEPRPARFIRLTHPEEQQHFTWTLANLEVWSR
ncbi:MAG TPA: hypothetical protein VMZ90_03440, partial [Vicinamibacterales bacterium]|nr:hypothetical protein [Vicinamibacterales bacterium]